MTDVRVLGAFEAHVAGAPADLGGPRQRSVLARLVAAGGRMVPADRIVADLWPEGAPPRAAGGLQSFVSHLRRALEPSRPPRTPAGVLVTAPPGYALRLPDDRVDAWAFEALTARAAERLAAGDPAAAARAAGEALTRWRGPAYAEFADLPWAAREADRLAELHRLAVEHRAAALLATGGAPGAVPDLEAHTAAHPFREEAWRLLALALYRAGRQGDALAALRRARARLTEELGVDPGPALRDLERDILAQSPALLAEPANERAAAPVLTVVPDAAPAHAFVGRAAELRRMDAAARDCAAGEGRLLLLSGDAGMGKTALVERFAADRAAHGWRTAWGRAPETGGAPAAWPWAELLRALAAADPPGGDLAARLAPLLDDAATPEGGDVQARRFRLHLAVGEYLGGLAGRAPLLLALDDLHWADEETLALLVQLAGRLRDRPVLIVATYRPTETPAALGGALALLARHEPERLELAGLPAAETAALVRAACATPLSDGDVAAIAERTGGNPFFTRESARLVDAEGLPAARRAVPAGVGDVLRRRFARLPAGAHAVLRVAAVLGREADLAVLTDVAGGDEDAVIDAVEAGLAAGLVDEPAPGRVRFAHALVRDALYSDLSRARRTRLHGAFAAALERHRPHETAAIAHHHLASGGDPERAVRYARLAAEAAETRFAYRAAAELWSRAADLLGAAGKIRERLETEIAAIRAAALAGDLMGARVRRQAAVALARDVGDTCLLARVIVAFDVPTLWSSRAYGSSDDAIVTAAESALAALPADAAELRVRLLTTIAIEREGEAADRGLRAGREAVALAREHGDPALLAVAFNGLYLNLYREPGHRDERWALANELLDLSRAHDLAVYRGLAHLQLRQAAAARLDFAAAGEHSRAGLRHVRDQGLALLEAIGHWHGGLDHVIAGRWDAAGHAYRRAWHATGGIWGTERGMLFITDFCTHLARGTLAGLLEETEEIVADWGHVDFAADLHAVVLAAAGRGAEAAHRAPPGTVRPDFFFDLAMSVRGKRAVLLGDRALGAETYAALLPWADHLSGGGCGVVTLGPVAQVLGDLAVLLDRPADAAAHYRHAAELSARVGAARFEREARAALRDLGTPAA
ncbi:ATP-binding protein [Actinomadura flavalba]|uniref:ATP-binding protein n=1 Tax=Actinomadura flavalba TaxID=1120938 RepID=UPI00047769A9|nr:BTAD domain-containing putative transcriptional regulator [Actinomadura flavalba]